MKNDLYFNDHEWHIGDKHIHMRVVCGARTRGKTSRYVFEMVKWWDKDKLHNKFVYLRRKKVQLEEVISKGVFNGARGMDDPEAIKMFARYPYDNTRDGRIYLGMGKEDNENCGYIFDLNNIKGVSVEDANVLYFDEYIELNRADYKGGDGGMHEPELFARLLETIFRRREFWVILNANADTYTNPYHEYFHIPFLSEKWTDNERGIMFTRDIAPPVAREHRAQTTIGRLFKGTNYDIYANGDRPASGISEDFFAERPPHAKLVCNVRIFNKILTFWLDEEHEVEYISDKYKENKQYQTISVTKDDMTVDSTFVAYCTNFLLWQKTMFALGKTRFSNGKVAELFYVIINIDK